MSGSARTARAGASTTHPLGASTKVETPFSSSRFLVWRTRLLLGVTLPPTLLLALLVPTPFLLSALISRATAPAISLTATPYTTTLTLISPPCGLITTYIPATCTPAAPRCPTCSRRCFLDALPHPCLSKGLCLDYRLCRGSGMVELVMGEELLGEGGDRAINAAEAAFSRVGIILPSSLPRHHRRSTACT